MSEFKSILKKALGFGLAAEVAFIGTGYYLYRKYNSDEEFRNKIHKDYPEVYESFKKVSEMYISVLPEDWKKRILDTKPGQSTQTEK